MPTVCFICNEYPPAPHGGIGTFTQVVGRHLTQADWGVRVLGLKPPRARELKSYQEDGDIQVFRVPFPRLDCWSIRANFRLFKTIYDWSRRGEIDLVEVPDAEGWCAGWLRLPVPVVVRVHGSSTYFAGELGRKLRRVTYWTERSSMRRSDYWCSVSNYAAQRTQVLFGIRQPDTVSYIPVEMPPSGSALRRSRTRVLFTGTLTWKKGIFSLVKAWGMVARRCPEAELHIYGKDLGWSGTPIRELLVRSVDSDVARSIVFHGHCSRSEVMEALREARAAVFPSYAEAFAFAPAEAMANGCPTIYSRRTSGPELIQDGRNGLLVDPEDPEEIADAIHAVLTDDQLAARLGAAGREHVRTNFSADVVMPSLQAFYRKCIAAFPRRSASMLSRGVSAGVE